MMKGEHLENKVTAEKRYLKYTFSDEERLLQARDVAQALRAKREAEGELKAVQTQAKAKITQLEATIDSVSSKLDAGFEMRSLPCKVTLCYDLDIVIVTREDTGEEVERRVMAAAERHPPLPMPANDAPDIDWSDTKP